MLSPQDLLAALQAQIIYMIMRFVDGAPEPIELNQQLVVTYQVSNSLRCFKGLQLKEKVIMQTIYENLPR